MKTSTQDHQVMQILNITEIRRIICDTDKGTLKLCIRKGESNYHFTLDAVELPKEVNKELFELLYPIETKEEESVLAMKTIIKEDKKQKKTAKKQTKKKK